MVALNQRIPIAQQIPCHKRLQIMKIFLKCDGCYKKLKMKRKINVIVEHVFIFLIYTMKQIVSVKLIAYNK
jgi:hypothetical protein